MPRSESLGLGCARCAAERPRRHGAALRVGSPMLARCAAGWSPPGGRARSKSVLGPCSMLALLVSVELIDLPFSYRSHDAVTHPGPPRPAAGVDGALAAA